MNDKTSADVIFSGSTYGDNIWTADSAGSRTFDIYLGGTYRISRYVLKHAGVNEENSDKNNRDFTVSAALTARTGLCLTKDTTAATILRM